MLGSKEIIKQREKGNIVIEPYNDKQVNPNSYDITLGNWFILPKESHIPIALDLASSVDLIWHEPVWKNNSDWLVLAPGDYILAHTDEYVGSHKYATLLKARSTFGRLFIDVCPSAGFGDIGYVNRWTLEIKNNSNNYYTLKPGMRVGQISFLEIKGKGKEYMGAYQEYQLRYTWQPESMLPKLGKERVF